MAERRMFAKSIIDSDAFVEMPMSTQCLYFHLGMKADDDGVVNNPKSIMRIIGAKDDDMNVLIAKKFILVLDNQIIVIKHWKINNYIQNDRYVPSKYKHLIEQLELDENKAYRNPCIQPISNMYTQDSIGKYRLVKDSIENNKNILAQSDNNLSTQIIIELTLNDKSLYPIYESQVEEWKELYPAVDVEQELRKMKGWLNANPQNRKTKKGILRFVNSWLSRSQDKEKNFQRENTTNEIKETNSFVEEKRKRPDTELLNTYQTLISLGLTPEKIKESDLEVYECAKRNGFA